MRTVRRETLASKRLFSRLNRQRSYTESVVKLKFRGKTSLQITC